MRREFHSADAVSKSTISFKIGEVIAKVEKSLIGLLQVPSDLRGVSIAQAYDMWIPDLARHFYVSISELAEDVEDDDLSIASFREILVDWISVDYSCDIFVKADTFDLINNWIPPRI